MGAGACRLATHIVLVRVFSAARREPSVAKEREVPERGVKHRPMAHDGSQVGLASKRLRVLPGKH